jgi:hypothetical protein
MLTDSLRHVAPSRIARQSKGRTAIGNPPRSKGVTAIILLLGVAAVALILSRHHVHWQWKAAWVAIIVFADLAVFSFAAVMGRGSLLQRGAESGDAGKGRKSREAQREPTGHLSEVLAALEARGVQSEAKQGLEQAMKEAQSPKQMPNGETAKAEAAATVKVEVRAAIADVAAQSDVIPPAASDEGLTVAQRLVAEQRKAAEALLLEACVLEERLNSEVQAAQAASEYAAARAKADGAAILEQQAKELARASSEHSAVLAAERGDAEKLVVTTRADAEAAKAQVAELEQQLQDARRLAEQTFSTVGAHEARAKESAAKQAAAEQDAAEALARVVACQAERAAAEAEAKAAEERAEALKKELPVTTQSLAGINDIQALAARIAKQASVLKRGPQMASR